MTFLPSTKVLVNTRSSNHPTKDVNVKVSESPSKNATVAIELFVIDVIYHLPA